MFKVILILAGVLVLGGCTSERIVKAPTLEFPVFGPYMTKDGNMLSNPLAWSQPMATPFVVWNARTKNYTLVRGPWNGEVTVIQHRLLSEAVVASGTFRTALKGAVTSPEIRRCADGTWRMYANMIPEGAKEPTLAVFKSNTDDSWSDYSFEAWLQKDVPSKDPTVFAYCGRTYLACVENGAIALHDLENDVKLGGRGCRIQARGLTGNPFAFSGPSGRFFMGYTAGKPMTETASVRLLELEGTDPLVAANWKPYKDDFLLGGNEFLGPCEASVFTSPDGSETWVAYQAFEYEDGSTKSWPVACLEKIEFDEEGRPKSFKPAPYLEWRHCPSGEPPYQARR